MHHPYIIRIFTLSIFTIFISTLTTAQDFTQYKKEWFVTANKDTLPYRILFPESYDKNKTYPLVLFLHGSGERGNNNESQLAWGAELFLKPENRRKFPAIIVFPQCAKDDYWSKVKAKDQRKNPNKRFEFPINLGAPNKGLNLTNQLINFLIKTESIDVKKLYVMGLSMGGMGTFELLARYPNRFAAAIPICGGGNANHSKYYAKNTSLWVFHGETDSVVGVKYSRRMVRQLQRFKADVKYTEYEGVDHFSWIPAFEEPEFLIWLFSKEL